MFDDKTKYQEEVEVISMIGADDDVSKALVMTPKDFVELHGFLKLINEEKLHENISRCVNVLCAHDRLIKINP